MKTRLSLVLPVLVLALALLAQASAQVGASAPAPLVVFLVRHAEKQKGGADAALTTEGTARAEVLANSLRSAGIETVHSSNYVRTRDTAAPVAKRLGLETQLYDPRDLPALATKLRETGGRHLVVGHSNTTPQLTALLGGEPGTPIEEAREYDRLYVVTSDGASTSTVLLRYGAAFEGAGAR